MINYTKSFKSGELSKSLRGRSDLDIYQEGCKDLQNFYVLPQGGVERRAGSKFISFTGAGSSPSGSNPAKLVPFDFSSSTKFMVEIGSGYIKVHNSSPTGAVENTDFYTPTGTVPSYTDNQLSKLQFVRRYDTMIITHPDFTPLKLIRTTIDPTFEVSNIDYFYPPLREQNLTSTTIHTSATTGTGIDIDSSSAIFKSGHVNSRWGINYIRTSSQRSVTDDLVSAGSNTGTAIDVSFSNWSVQTDANFTGTVIIERDLNDGAGFISYVVLGTSSGTDNFSYASTTAEDSNTQIRAKLLTAGGTACNATITNQELYFKGVVEIKTVNAANKSITQNTRSSGVLRLNCTSHGLSAGDKVLLSGVTSADSSVQTALESDLTVSASNLNTNDFQVTLTGTAALTFASDAKVFASSSGTCDVKSILSNSGSGNATTLWQEAAFSDDRGFPASAEFYQNRLFFTGSKTDPATIFASVRFDIYNFLLSETNISDMAIKRIPDTPEEAKFIIGKKDLFMGTEGNTISIKSVNQDESISATNIVTEIQNAYGSSNIQPVIANDSVVFTQKNNLKLRELVYSRDNNVFVANDLNLFSEDITDSQITEMYVQKNPYQIIWCIKTDGTACILTYDRQTKLQGWSRVNTTGSIFSGNVLSNTGEDNIWLCVKRDSKYVIEQLQPRLNLNWYVDSGKELDGGTVKTITASISTDITITAANHGYSNGDIVKIKNSGSKQLAADVFAVSDSATNTFKLKDKTATSYEVYNNTNNIVVSGAVESSTFNGTYELDSTVSTPYWNLKDSATGINISMQEDSPTTHYWVLRNNDGSVEFQLGATQTSQANLLNTQWWAVTYDNSDATKRAFRSATFGLNTGATVEKVYNEITGLNHLEGKTVQVVGDNNFIKEVTVSSNKITTDEYYNSLLAGLQFTSIVRPMPFEPTIRNQQSQGRVKAVGKIIARFLNTKGAKIGEEGNHLTNYPTTKTNDITGQAISLVTDSKRFFTASNWDREKVIEVKQDLPYPMTLISLSSWLQLEGG